MLRILRACILLLSMALLPAGAVLQAQRTDLDYNDVIVLVNDSSSQSQEIASYFALRRGIPDRRIFHFEADTTYEYFIDSARFTRIRYELQTWMAERNLVDSIRYIVTTKGCPLVVSVEEFDRGAAISGYSAFDAALSLINGRDSALILQPFSTANLEARRNRFFGSIARFKRDPDIFPLYLVSRLDGFTVDDVKRMIDSAAKPVSRSEGLWLFDLDPTFAANAFKPVHDRTEAAAIRLRDDLKLQVFLDPTDARITEQENVLWYFTWGPFATGNVGVPPRHSWAPGSVAMVVTGLAGQTFYRDTARKNSLLFGELIAEGVTGGATWSIEPYAFGIPYQEVATERYAQGWNLAESFFAATPLAGFRTIVVGDPKMKLAGLLTPEPDILSFNPAYRFEPRTDTGFFRNDNPRPITVTGMRVVEEENAGNSLPEEFSVALPPPFSFPITVQPDDSLVVLVTHRSTIYGGVQARVEVAFDLPNGRGAGTSYMSVVGSGKRPGMDVPDQLYFGVVPDGGTATRTLRIRNLAMVDTLLLNGMALSGEAAGRFTFDHPPTETLRIPGSAEISFDITYINSENRSFDQARATLNTNSEPATRRVSLDAGLTLGVDDKKTSKRFALEAAPTPSAGPVAIRCTLPAGTARLRVEIVDVDGSVVSAPFDGDAAEGSMSLHPDIDRLPSGVYTCRVHVTRSSGDVETETVPIVLRK